MLKKLNKLDKAAKNKIDISLTEYKYHTLEDIQELIKSGADINAKNDIGWTALIYASIEGNTDRAKLLIINNADINSKSRNGNTALIWASYWGRIDIAKILIDNHADINAKNIYGKTALMVSNEKGYKDIANLIEAKLKGQQQ